jgi:hypothetical protein
VLVDFLQAGAVRADTIRKAIVSIAGAEQDVAVWIEQRRVPFDVRDLARRRAAVERCQPEPVLSRRVDRFEDHPLAVVRNVERRSRRGRSAGPDRKAGQQTLVETRVQIGDPQLAPMR